MKHPNFNLIELFHFLFNLSPGFFKELEWAFLVISRIVDNIF